MTHQTTALPEGGQSGFRPNDPNLTNSKEHLDIHVAAKKQFFYQTLSAIYTNVCITQSPTREDFNRLKEIELFCRQFQEETPFSDIEAKVVSLKIWMDFWHNYSKFSSRHEQTVCGLNALSDQMELERLPLSLKTFNQTIASALKGIELVRSHIQQITPELRANIFISLAQDLKLALDACERYWPEYQAALHAEIVEARQNQGSPGLLDAARSEYILSSLQEMGPALFQQLPRSLGPALFKQPIDSPAYRQAEDAFQRLQKYISGLKLDDIHPEAPISEKSKRRLLKKSGTIDDDALFRWAIARPTVSEEMRKREADQAEREQQDEQIQQGMPDWEKRLLGVFFLALQIAESSPDLVEASKRTKQLAAELKQQITEPIRQELQKDYSFIGVMLSDKLNALRKVSDETFLTLTKHTPRTREILQKFRTSTEPLSVADIAKAQDQFITSEIAKILPSKSPFQSIDISTWQQAFMTAQPASESVTAVGSFVFDTLFPALHYAVDWMTGILPAAQVPLKQAPLKEDSPRVWEAVPAQESFMSAGASAKRTDSFDEMRKTASLQSAITGELTLFAPEHHFLQKFIEIPTEMVIDDPLFQHVLGDYFGRGTGMEGYQSLQMSMYLAKVLSIRNATLSIDDPSISPKILDLMAHQMKTAVRLQDLFEHNFDEFNKAFRAEIDHLPIGRALFFQGTWHYKDSGHAVEYEVIKQDDGRYTFRVYNRGAGIDRYHSMVSKDEKMANLFTEIVDIDKNKIISPSFLKALSELRLVLHQLWDPEKELYENILASLDGKMSHREYSLDQTQEVLDTGHCTYLAWNALFYQKFKLGLPRIEYEIKLKTLLNYYQQNKHRLKEEIVRKSLQKGVSHFARKVKRLAKSGVVSPMEAAETSKKIAAIQSAIAIAEETHLKAVFQNRPAIAFSSPADHERFSLNIRETSAPPDPSAPKPVTPPLVIDLPPFQARTFYSDLLHFQEQIHQAHKKNDLLSIFQYVQRFIEPLPVEWMQKPMSEWGQLVTPWHAMSEEEASKTVEALADIGQHFLYSAWANVPCGWLGCSQEMSTDIRIEGYLTLIKLLTVADAISRSRLHVALPSLYQNNFDAVLEGKSSSITLFDSQWGQQMDALRSYWLQIDPPSARAKRKDLSFFGVDKKIKNKNDRSSDIHPDCGDFCRVLAQKEKTRSETVLRVHFEDFRWLQNFLQQSDIQAKIRSDFPKISQMSIINQIRYFAYPSERYDSIKEIIPPSFFALRNLSMIADFYLMISPGRSRTKPDFSSGLKLQANGFVDFIERKWPFGLDAHDVNEADNFIFSSQRDFHHLLKKGDLLPITGELQPFYSHDEQTISRRREAPHSIPLILPPHRFNTQDAHDLFQLSAKEGSQIINTLGYFTQKSPLLQKPEHQRFLQKLLFEGDLLLKELKKQPLKSGKLADQLATFCRNQYSILQGDIPTALFLLEINDLLAQQVAVAAQGAPDDYRPTFLDSTKEFHRLLALGDLTENDQIALQTFSALRYQSSRSIERDDVIQLLSAVIYLNMLPPKAQEKEEGRSGVDMLEQALGDLTIKEIFEDLRQPRTSFESSTSTFQISSKQMLTIRDLLSKFRTDIYRVLHSPDKKNRNEVLNRIVKNIYPEFSNVQWKSDGYPRFQSIDGTIEVDVQSGTIFMKTGKLASLPISLLQDPLIKQFFPEGARIIGRQIDAASWEISTPTHELYRISGNNPSIFYQQIDGVWYEHIDPNILPVHLGDSLHFWQSDLLEASKILVGDRSNHFQFTIDITSPDSCVVRRINDGKETDLVLENLLAHPHPYTTLAKFEDLSHILVWKKHQDTTSHSIDLPRLNLHFQIRNKKAYCSDIKGYWIADRQTIPALGDIPQYLVLENAQHKKIVLIPNRELLDVESSLRSDFSLGDVASSRLKIKQELFNLDAETIQPTYFRYALSDEGDLKPSDLRSHLHLAMLMLSEHDYESAQTLLKSFDSQTRAYSLSEVAQLWEIATFASINSDHDPRAVAIRLHAHFILIRNCINFSSETKKLILKGSDIKAVQEEYIQKKDQIPIYLQLKESQLQLINDFLPQSPDFSSAPFVGVRPLPHNNPINIVPIDSRELRTLFNPHEDPPKAPSYLLAQHSFSENFGKLYELIQSTLDESKALQWIKLSSNLILPAGLPLQNLKKEIQTQLILFIRSNSENDLEKQAAEVLLAVLQKPDDFPSIEKVQKAWDYDLSPFIEIVNQHLAQINQQIQKRPLRADHPTEKSIWPTAPSPLRSAPLPHVCFSISPPPSLRLPNPFDRLIIPIAPSKEDRERAETVSESLQKVFATDPRDRQIRQKFNELRKRIERYRPPPAQRFRLREGFDLTLQEDHLRKDAAAMDIQLKEQEEKILTLANRMPHISEEITERHLDFASTDQKEIEMKDVIVSFSLLDSVQLSRANPSLTTGEIEQIYQQTVEYLVMATHRQHLLRIIQMLRQTKSAAKEGKKAELDLNIDALARALQGQREYDIREHPEFLVFEHANDLLLRKEQVEALKKMKTSPSLLTPHDLGVLLEMIMGFGKTAVLLPLIAAAAADGKHVPFAMMPESLTPTMAALLKQILGQTFHQPVDSIPINRQTDLDAAKLRNLRDLLQTAKEERRVMVETSSSMQSLFLKLNEKLLAALESIEPNTYEEIHLFREIIQELHQSPLNMDEADFILDILKSHHFSVGAPQPLKAETIDTTVSLFHLLVTSERIKPLLQVGFLAHRTGRPFTTTHYEQSIRPILIDEILAGNWSAYDPELNRFFQKLSLSEQLLIKAYLNNQANPAAATYVDKIPSMKIKNCLAVLKEEISQVLMLTMKKEVNVHHGPVPPNAPPDVPRLLSIPFHGSDNPAVRSQFGTELEILNYSIQQYLALGIPLDFLIKELELLRHQISLDVLEKKLNFEDSPAYRDFLQLCNGLKIDLLHTSSQQLQELLHQINQNPSQQLHFIRKFALPDVRVYPKQLNTNAQILSLLFRSISGFSGTLWNAETFPDAFGQREFSDTDVKTLHILWDKSPHQVTVIDETLVSQDSLKTSLEKMFDADDLEKGVSISDAGAMLRNYKNEQIARQMLEQYGRRSPHSEIKGVIFYNDNDQLAVIEKGKDRPIPLAETDLKYDQMAAFWDQKHARGSDLKLSPEMHVIVTISRHTKLYDQSQAAWRLRLLDWGQRASFAVKEEDRQVIVETLKKEWPDRPEAPLSLGDILIYTFYIQAERQGADNFRALKQKMQNVLLDPFVELLCDPSVTEKEIVEVFEALQELFISTTPQDPYLVYGQMSEQAPSQKVVQEITKQFLSSHAFRAFRQHPILKRFNASELEAKIRKIAADEQLRLPDFLQLNTKYETEVQIEKEAEKEKEKEKEKEMQVKIPDPPKLSAYPVFEWNPDNLFQKEYFTVGSASEITESGFSLQQYRSAHRSPFFSVNEALGVSKSAKTPQFHPNLLATPNFYPVYRRGSLKDYSFIQYFINKDWIAPPTPLFDPFGLYQQTNPHLLVVQDKKTHQIQTILLDLEDADTFAKFIEQDCKKRQLGQRDVNICLYHPDTGIYRTSGEGFDEQALEHDPSFILLKTQAKFLNGATFFSALEQEALKAWIREQGPVEIYQFFQEKILQNKPTSRASFEHSSLEQVFQSVGIETKL